jgi:hypothetical protein
MPSLRKLLLPASLILLGSLVMECGVTQTTLLTDTAQPTAAPTATEILQPDEVRNAVIGCFILGVATSAAGAGLLRSSRLSQNKAKALELESEQDRLRGILYQLIADKQGAFTLVQFAIAADIPPKAAQNFLDQQATAFNADFTVSEQGAVVYQFPVS